MKSVMEQCFDDSRISKAYIWFIWKTAWVAAITSERENVELLRAQRDAWEKEAGIWIRLCHLKLQHNKPMDAEIKTGNLQKEDT